MAISRKNSGNTLSIPGLLAKAMKFLPLRAVSRAAGWIANRPGASLLQRIIPVFVKSYGINLSEAALPAEEFRTFNEFFDRELKKGARPIAAGNNTIVSPVDGAVLTNGRIEDNIILEAKGTGSSLDELLVTPEFKKRFIGGDYMIIYLSPRDYHRIHSPVKARILGYTNIPGRLYPVNSFAVNNVDRLFSVNERLVTYLEVAKGKLCALVAVGATNVGSIRVTYKESIRTNRVNRVANTEMFDKPVAIDKGEELGRFEIGSTVILLFEKGLVNLSKFNAGDRLQMGQAIGKIKQGKQSVESEPKKRTAVKAKLPVRKSAKNK